MNSLLDRASPTDASPTDLAWRIVGLANLYRLLAVLVLLAVHKLTLPTPAFGGARSGLFLWILSVYFLLGVLLTLAGRRHWPGRRTLVLTHTLIDSSALSLLMYASGGVASNLGILFVIPVASMALLAIGREALVVAAIAALAILAQQIAAQLSGIATEADYPLAGVMGTVVFLIAASTWPVARRLRESEAQVRKQEVDLANMAQLSQFIVQRLRESILVVDPGDRVRLINESAAQLLGDAAAVPGALLGEVSPRLLYLLTTWRRQEAPPDASRAAPETRHAGAEPAGTFASADGARVIEPHFAPLGANEPAPVLVFLEDKGALAARIQQSKLAALGRLTASIAHEIRNPVGAMSHAAQLLAESAGIGPTEARLTEIMRSNAQRVSGIIDNVLRLSRREAPRPERVMLPEWCERFRVDFCATTQCSLTDFTVQVTGAELEVRVDLSQLQQILWNLCENALRHGARGSTDADGRGNASGGGTPRLELNLSRVARFGRVCLEVADRGAGVAPQDVERIFEPFFTRGADGTGLGLFLARELAEINDATLLYEARKGGGSLFRLVFADPSRWAEATLFGVPGS